MCRRGSVKTGTDQVPFKVPISDMSEFDVVEERLQDQNAFGALVGGILSDLLMIG